MKKFIYPACLMLLMMASAFTIISNYTWKVQESYSVKFTSKKFEGIFKGLEASIIFDETNLAKSKITASIDANSANTGNGMRNKHTAQALGAEKFPRIKFESTSISKKGNGYEAIGKLSINDVTKDITLPFTFVNNTFSGKFPLITKEYNISKSGSPEEVEVHLNVPVTK